MRVENSFIPVRGVGPATERRLWAAGVTHWDEFDGSVVGPTLADRIGNYIATGRERLDQGRLEFFAEDLAPAQHWRLSENAGTATMFLDIETTGLDPRRHRVTTVSVHRDGDTRTYVAGRDLTADHLTTELEESELLVTFNGRQFDIPFLETEFDLDVQTPHLDLLYPCRKVGFDGGLTAVERAIGLQRERPDISGADAVRLWREYERGDHCALETLIAYNREDTTTLRPVLAAVTDRLHETVFASVVRGD